MLFVSDAAGGERNRGGGLSESGIYQAMTRRWRQAGCEGCFGAHRLRHGLATLLVEANVSLAIVSEWLGHAQIPTTRLYSHPTASAMAQQVAPIVERSLREIGYVPRSAA